MKKTVLLSIFILVCCFAQAQDNNQLESLLARYEAIGSNGNSIHHYFSNDELQLLRSHFAPSIVTSGNNRGAGEATLYCVNNTTFQYGTLNTIDPATFNEIGTSSGSDFESAGDIDPFDLETAYVLTLNDGLFYSVDVMTGVYTQLGTIDPPSGQQWNGLEFDPATGILYAISSNFATVSTLSTIDIENLSFTEIGPTGFDSAIAIAIDNSGTIYSYSVDDSSLYTINKSTGAGTLVGSIGFIANYGQDLEWDAASETMFMTAYNNGVFEAQLRTVNLQTGATTLVGIIDEAQSNTQVAWSAIQNEGNLSVPENEALVFSIYPNPATTSLYVEAPFSILKLELFSILGERVVSVHPQQKEAIDISGLSAGTYLVKVYSDNGFATQLMVKK